MIITALQEADHPSRRMFLGNPQNVLGHLRKVAVFEHEPAKKVAFSGVKTGRDDRQIGWKFLLNREEGRFKSFPMNMPRGATAQGDIEGKAFALPSSDLVGRAGS